MIPKLVTDISRLQYLPLQGDRYHISSAEVTLNRGSGSCIDVAIAAAFLAEPLGYPPDILNIHARKQFCAYHGKQIPYGHSLFFFNDGSRFNTVNLPTENEEETTVIRKFRTWREMIDTYRALMQKRDLVVDRNSWSIFNLNEAFPDIDWRRTEQNLAEYLFDDDIPKK